MRLVCLIPLIALAGACRAPQERMPGEPTPPSYYSENRTSVAFIKEAYRDSKQMRRDNLRTSADFKSRRPENRRQERAGRSYFWESFKHGEWDNGRQLIKGVRAERKRETEKGKIRKSFRFGFLDRGE